MSTEERLDRIERILISMSKLCQYISSRVSQMDEDREELNVLIEDLKQSAG